MKKVLIIRFSSIGDIVLTTPVIRCLKEQTDFEVHYLTKKGFKGILEHNPNIDKLHLLEGGMKDLLQCLKAENFDYIVDLHRNLRTLRIKSSLRSARAYTFKKANKSKWLMVQFKINKLPKAHIVERYMDTVQALNVKNDEKGLDYFVPHKDEIEDDWLPETHKEGYVAFAIGGQHQTKRLPVPKMIELCDKINRPIVLLGGPDDAKDAEKIEDFFKKGSDSIEKGLLELNKKTVIFNGVGKFNLNQSASLIKSANYVFTHDSGLMHIAAAFKKEIFSIWGNTIPEFGMYPYQTQFTILENNNLNCRPCSKIGYKKCPKGHFKCMNEQRFDFYLPEA